MSVRYPAPADAVNSLSQRSLSDRSAPAQPGVECWVLGSVSCQPHCQSFSVLPAVFGPVRTGSGRIFRTKPRDCWVLGSSGYGLSGRVGDAELPGERHVTDGAGGDGGRLGGRGGRDTFTLTLSNPSGATLGDDEATIADDDEATAALTAAFHGMPAEHDGSQLFSFEIWFSEESEELRLTAFEAGRSR